MLTFENPLKLICIIARLLGHCTSFAMIVQWPLSQLSKGVYENLGQRLTWSTFRLYSYLEEFKILYPLQYGFREKCSTTHAVISITESIRQSIDNNEFDCGIFIDLQKAFDSVNHAILLTKRNHNDIRGVLLDWLKSYLSQSKQFVHVNGHNSLFLPVTCGVLQGSILGPLLFLLYVNDLPNTSCLLTFHLFADDTNIYFSSKNLSHLEATLNHELLLNG